MGSGLRTVTPEASEFPLFPTTKVYVRPPRQTGVARSGVGKPEADGASAFAVRARCWFAWVPPADVGHERAHTGSGLSSCVMVRSTAGRTVVASDAVLLTPVFLMLAVAVAVLKMVE